MNMEVIDGTRSRFSTRETWSGFRKNSGNEINQSRKRKGTNHQWMIIALPPVGFII